MREQVKITRGAMHNAACGDCARMAANWEIAIKGGEVYKIAPLQK